MRRRRFTWVTAPMVCAALAMLLTDARGQQAEPVPSPDEAEPTDPAQQEDPQAQACLASFKEAQRFRKLKPAPKLLAARDELVKCSQAACPDAIVVRCQEWLGEVNAAIPTVLLTAHSKGVDVVDVKVTIDGVERPDAMSGSPIELDPGVRRIVARRGGVERHKTLLIVQSKKNRPVDFVFPAKKPPPPPGPGKVTPPPDGFTMPLLGWIGFGVGIVAVVVGSITGGIAISKGSELQDECRSGICGPTQEGDYDAGLGVAHTSTVSFIVGGAGVAVGFVGLIIGDDEPKNGEQVYGFGLGGEF
jgi:hypothetical protein